MATGNYKELKQIDKIVNEALIAIDKVYLSGLLGYTHQYSKQVELARNYIAGAKDVLQDITKDINS